MYLGVNGEPMYVADRPPSEKFMYFQIIRYNPVTETCWRNMNLNSINSISIMGRITKSPIISNSDGDGIASTTLWVETRQVRHNNGKRTGRSRIKSQEHKCIFYRHQASEICDLHGNAKSDDNPDGIIGCNIHIAGSLNYRVFPDAETGIQMTLPHISVQAYTMISDYHKLDNEDNNGGDGYDE